MKIFSCTESGKKEPVTNFVNALRSELVSPLDAARFVSLIPLYVPPLVANAKSDVWQDLDTYILLNKPDFLL